MCVLSAVYATTTVLVAIVPKVLYSFWAVFIGIFAFAYTYPMVHRNNQARISRRREHARIIREQKCCICLHNNSTHTVYPCLHSSYCGNCVARIEECALCRSPITDRRLEV